ERQPRYRSQPNPKFSRPQDTGRHRHSKLIRRGGAPMFVKVTYQAWDHNGKEIPPELHPRVGFKPLQTSLYNGMLTSREVWGTLNPDGTGEVMLENTPGILYVPFIEWLADPSQWAEKVENRAVGRSEWKPIIP